MGAISLFSPYSQTYVYTFFMWTERERARISAMFLRRMFTERFAADIVLAHKSIPSFKIAMDICKLVILSSLLIQKS